MPVRRIAQVVGKGSGSNFLFDGGKMGVLGDPFKLFGRLLISAFKITGYTLIFILQVVWYLFHRQHDIGLAFGDYGRSITNTIGDVFSD